jgi:hypothetical protein
MTPMFCRAARRSLTTTSRTTHPTAGKVEEREGKNSFLKKTFLRHVNIFTLSLLSASLSLPSNTNFLWTPKNEMSVYVDKVKKMCTHRYEPTIQYH